MINKIDKVEKYGFINEGKQIAPILDELNATSKKILGISKKLMKGKYNGAKKLMSISVDIQRVYEDLYNEYYPKDEI